MKHNTGQTLVQSRRLIVSVSMFSRLQLVNKADIIGSFLKEINLFKMCARSNQTRSHILSFNFAVVERLGILDARSICSSNAIEFKA